MGESILKDWDNFYVIMGSAAAGLTGLTFVVIALSAEANRANPRGVRVYVTPTIVHFGVVLGLAAYLSMPRHTELSLSWGFGVVGAAGLIYALGVGTGIRGVAKDYVPVLEDWLWNLILPAAAYGTLLAAALLFRHYATGCMYAVAAVTVGLTFIGIHNSWDIAVWHASRRPNEPRERGDRKTER
ncbi:MAG TPA: hypothetical protein VHZ53_18395 [Steroidobacteraceae bacterium]|jgi:hypothetical protein|nr:hypothetical protein [Steroidobacteraceae bacterium]